MDSIETINPIAEVPAQEATGTSATPVALQTKEDVIERLKTLNEQEEIAGRPELEALKQTFYRLRNAEVEAAKKAFVENGGNEDEFVPEKDDSEERFKEVMGRRPSRPPVPVYPWFPKHT